MPICNKCGMEKAQEEFTKDNRKPGGHSKICQKCTREWQKNWENVDKERIFQRRKQYRKDNAEYIAQKKKEQYEANRDVELEKRHQYYIEHREELLAQCKQYREEHVEWKKAYDKRYAEENWDRIYEYKKWHKEQNWDHYNEMNRQYMRKRRKEDMQYRLALNCRSRIRTALRYNKKSNHSLELVGCTLQELKQWLESQFVEGMSWDNWGKPKVGEMRWNIDHIIPVTWFDLSDPEQQKHCFHYTNLQPMWWQENLKKSNRYIGAYKEA